MADYLNFVAIAYPRNGSSTHTLDPSNAGAVGTVVAGTPFSFTGGRFGLVAVEGAVTSSTPSGWTLPTGGSAVNNTGLYAWYRASLLGGDTMSTTHNGSNYPIIAVFFEFTAGTTFNKAATSTSGNANSANPTISSLTGTNWLMAMKATVNGGGVSPTTATWSGATEILDTTVAASGTDGYALYMATTDSSTATSFAPTASVSGTGLIAFEMVTLAVTPAAGSGTTKVVKTSATTWAVRARITKTLSNAWAVRASVQKSLATAWSVRTSVAKTIASAWAIRSQVAKALATNWAVRSRTTKASSTQWAVRSTLVKTAVSNWAVRVQVTKTATTLWNIAGMVGKVVKTVATNWAIRSTISKTSATSWKIRQQVSKSASTAWALRAQVIITPASGWSIRSRVVTTLLTSWAIRQAVLRAIPTDWAVRLRVSKLLSTAWNLAGAPGAIVFHFELTDGTPVTIEGIWDGVEIQSVTVSLVP